jgi:endonuclease III
MARSLIRWANHQLLDHYARPAWELREEPLSELIATVLSQHTSDVNCDRAFASLRAAFPRWEEVRDAPPSAIENAIRCGGLATVKAPRIQSILRALTDDRGRVVLPEPVERDFLLTLPGVGRKTASCVLLFGAHVPAIPVDTHVHRVALRTGMVTPKTSPDVTCDALEAALPKADYYAFHVNLIRHGRKVCKAQRPLCGACVLRQRCQYFRQSMP